ncbi:oligosaccharide flippase family protein [Paracoccus zhejiangensis]|uniref:Polysaccharide biosynthesis protein n=1 Tax=Paracoccus zhejiangensis TaxID=1077935 RepID=A0A2H5EX20_9RHOB|nr:oligosaccharide flippase family protein [Paracoccus zhejiangensis]AUH63824.1 polysaccharide biosynthesis protein [Paracoccus zhejiangensis]
MIRRLTSRLYHDEGLSWRALRSGMWTLAGFGGGQALRLVVNLALARLLFPSAFGTMALIMVLIQGLNNFSDVGTRPAVLRSPRGDDPDFLNTAWTIEIMRGVALWLVCCALAVPYARFYDAPEIAAYLVVAGFGSVIHGLQPMRILTAERHMSLRQVTKADLLSQVITSVMLVILAWVTASIWALVVMLVVGGIVRILIMLWMIPGHRDRLQWDREAVHELTSFGKWIFPSTILGFLINQGDKAIFGRYLTLTQLGLYNIGFFLASFPQMLGSAIVARIMIPLYRESPPGAGPNEFGRIRRIRFALTGGILSATLLVAFLGPWLVELLYDQRYQQSGIMVTLIASVVVPQVILLGNDLPALAAGDSRGFFYLIAVRAVLFLSCFWIGSHFGGLLGALLGQAVGTILSYPALALLARRHHAWDPLHDGVFALIAVTVLSLILFPRLDEIRALAQVG